jgi:adenylosuccinate synthase
MGVTAVIGLQWGDEGKGKVVDALCHNADIVVRCQGGANAGHTIVVDGRKFILHLVPSGILRPGVRCLIGSGVAVDLEVLDQEIKEISEAGIDVLERLVVSRRAHVVLPIHRHIESLRERLRGSRKLGTTRRGIGPTYSDKYTRLGIRVGDVMNASTLPAKIQALRQAYDEYAFDEPIPDSDDMLAFCSEYRHMLGTVTGDTLSVLSRGISQDKQVLLEGAQGFLLDIDHGTYPYVTSCNTGVHGLACGAGLAPSAIDEVVGVVKSYMTRVGEGPMPTQMEEPVQTLVREKGCEYGATTGRPRRCGWLDMPALRYSCSVNGVTALAITKIDTLAGLETVKVCTAYEHSGEVVQGFPADIELLQDCAPRYADLPSWPQLDCVGDLAELPAGALDYVQRIAQVGGCPPRLISTGPGRSDLVYLDR